VGATDRAIESAVALSAELMCKLGVACTPRGDGPGSEWFLTQVFGYAAAAVGAGLALGLNEQQLVSAIGLSYMQVAGGKEAGFGTGSNARSIYPAFAAQGGLQAALMARAGVVGPASALDGAAGLFRIYFGAQLARPRRRLLTDFTRWQYRDVQTKPWPSCRLSHPYIAVALDARKTCLENPGARISVAVNASAARLCRPIAERRRPLTLQDAKYSIPFMTAFTLVRGDPGLTKLDDLALRDTAVLDMAMRVDIDETLADKPGHPMAVLTLELGRRKLLTTRFRPAVLAMDAAGTQAKFEDCLAYAGAGAAARRIWKQLMQGKVRAALRQLNLGDD
jgi:2-methylcitrate dehydratase PrpD